MTSIRPFQIVLFVVFGLMAILALVLLSRYTGDTGGEGSTGQFGDSVIMWGPFPQPEMQEVFDTIQNQNYAFQVVKYYYVDPANFHNQFVNALAEGRSPDVVILPHTELVAQKSKLLPITYSTEGFSERDIRDAYIDGAEIFMLTEGLYALPLAVDPLLLYWNRDWFATEGLAAAPTTWSEVTGRMTSTFTERDNNRNVIKSAVPLGEYANIRNAEGILAALALQSGSKMVTPTTWGYQVEIDDLVVKGQGQPPMQAAVQFYTSFANSASPVYAWNRAKQEDRQAFTTNEAAMYLGLASEYDDIQKRNPNLNFDVALLPQGDGATVKRTYGVFYGAAIPKAAANPQGGFAAARLLSSPQYAQLIQQALYLAPAQRALVSNTGATAYQAVFNQSVLIARGWLSPAPRTTAEAFQTLIEDVSSNRLKVADAVDDFITRLRNDY